MAGVVLLRELDERFGVTRRLVRSLTDPRQSGKVIWSLGTQLRARVYALAAGFGAQRDVTALSQDPMLRLSSSERRGVQPLKEGLMSQPTLARLQRILGLSPNLSALKDSVFALGLQVIRAAGAAKGAHTLDVDSMPVMSHGQQPGSVWNGYYRGRCFHPLMALHGETGSRPSCGRATCLRRRARGAFCSSSSRPSNVKSGRWAACAATRASPTGLS
jgi:hypothetical protein